MSLICDVTDTLLGGLNWLNASWDNVSSCRDSYLVMKVSSLRLISNTQQPVIAYYAATGAWRAPHCQLRRELLQPFRTFLHWYVLHILDALASFMLQLLVVCAACSVPRLFPV